MTKKNALKNKTIVITRPMDSVEPLKSKIEAEGGRTILFPTTKIVATDDWQACDRAISTLSHYDWIIFSSNRGAEFFFGRLKYNTKKIERQKIGVIGAKTAEYVSSHGLAISLLPEKYSAAGFLQALCKLKLDKSIISKDITVGLSLLVSA